MKNIITTGIITVLILAGIGVVSANLVVNPSFEVKSVSGGFAERPAGNTDMTDWIIGAGGIDQIHEYWVADDGSQSVDLSRLSRGEISQQIISPTGSYILSFSMSGNPECGNDIKTLEVYWENNKIATETFDASIISNKLTDMHWKTVTLPVTATSSNPVLLFKDVTTGTDTRCGVALDKIAVVEAANPVPEFPSMALPVALIVGLIGAVLFIRQSKEN